MLKPQSGGGSYEFRPVPCFSKLPPQSMFWSKNKKNRYTPIFLCKNGVRGGILFMDMFSWCSSVLSKKKRDVISFLTMFWL